VKYGFVSLMKNEFTGLTMTFRGESQSGSKVLTQFGLDNQGDIGQNLLALMGIYLFLLVMAYYNLRQLVKGRQAVDILANAAASKAGSVGNIHGDEHATSKADLLEHHVQVKPERV
jgi:hypothetical protein